MDTRLKVILTALPVVAAALFVGSNVYDYKSQCKLANQNIQMIERRMNSVKYVVEHPKTIDVQATCSSDYMDAATARVLQEKCAEMISLNADKQIMQQNLEIFKSTPWYKIAVGRITPMFQNK